MESLLKAHAPLGWVQAQTYSSVVANHLDPFCRSATCIHFRFLRLYLQTYGCDYPVPPLPVSIYQCIFEMQCNAESAGVWTSCTKSVGAVLRAEVMVSYIHTDLRGPKTQLCIWQIYLYIIVLRLFSGNYCSCKRLQVFTNLALRCDILYEHLQTMHPFPMLLCTAARSTVYMYLLLFVYVHVLHLHVWSCLYFLVNACQGARKIVRGSCKAC